MPFSLFLALKYLRPKRSFISIVTAISIIGVLLGVAIIIIVRAVMTGFGDMWEEKILSFRPHLVVRSAYGFIEDEEALSLRLETLEGIVGVSPAIQTQVLLKSDSGRPAAPIVLGMDASRAKEVTQVPTRIMPGGEFDLEDDGLVLGVDLAFSLHAEVGSKVLLYSYMNLVHPDEMYLPEELTVTGIFNLGMRDYDSNFILTSLDTARELVGRDSGADSIYMMMEDPDLFPIFVERVRAELGPAYIVESWADIDRVLFEALRHEKILMMVLLFCITIVAIFCVANTLIVISVQKTKEIGLMKALGFSSGKIVAAFVWLGWIQCLVGTGAGIATAFLVLFNLKSIVAWLASFNVKVFPKEIYGLSEIPWSISPMDVVQIGVFVLVFCTVACVLPAYMAARLDPVESLRQE
jgi:lipoprotein-releasing system permease protein